MAYIAIVERAWVSNFMNKLLSTNNDAQLCSDVEIVLLKKYVVYEFYLKIDLTIFINIAITKIQISCVSVHHLTIFLNKWKTDYIMLRRFSVRLMEGVILPSLWDNLNTFQLNLKKIILQICIYFNKKKQCDNFSQRIYLKYRM